MRSTANTLLLEPLNTQRHVSGHAADDTTGPSEQAAASSCTESTSKRFHSAAVAQRRLIRNYMCAQKRSKGIRMCTQHEAREQIPLLWVSKQPGVLCRQTHCQQEWNWKLQFCSSSSLSTFRRNSLFPSSSFLQRLTIHTTNTLTAETRLSWLLVMLKNSSLKMDGMNISH